MQSTFPASASPLLHALRAGTAKHHSDLERRLPFFSEAFDLTSFISLTQAYYGFYIGLEEALQNSCQIPVNFDLPSRLKSPLLHQDLVALGVSKNSIYTLPFCECIPTINSQGAFLGVMYVLEGATLGGQIIARRISERFHLDASTGTAFFNAYGADTGRRWQQFLYYLNHCSVPRDDFGLAVNAAKATFRSFEAWLETKEVLV